MAQIKESADQAVSLLGRKSEDDPDLLIGAIDEFIDNWQNNKRPDLEIDAEDLPYLLGSLWGEQLVSQFGWQWKAVTLHSNVKATAPGVVTTDRSLVVYPIHFIIGCLADSSVDTTILLSYNMLKAKKVPSASSGEYVDLMKNVFRIVPRA